MKKFFIHIYIFAAAVLLAASCETPLFIEPVGEECQTVLQARLLTSDSLHTVHASYSLHDSVIPADDLTIRCFVNGQNLLTFSPLLKDWGYDPENLSGQYPTLKSVNAGISITF